MRKRKSLSQKITKNNCRKLSSITLEKNKINITIYFLLRVLVIISMIGQGINGNWNNVVLCVLTLLLFTLPNLISKKLHIALPEPLEIMVYLFIFSAEILGEIQNFYGIFEHWDTLLHTLNGFLCAAIGFSLVDILNHKEEIDMNMSPIFVALVAFSFSMTVGVIWEFVEYGADKYLESDMQKDRMIEEFQSIRINPKKNNSPIKVKNIKKTIIYLKENVIVIDGGYLDIGLQDTMKDLIVNFMGAVIFSIIGYLYLKNKERYEFIEVIIPKKKK
ncbi:MAG: hypothetical protein IKF71_02140 [Bacilli bacterium]|nr:hypothetical protein [Bacilli bacterium]